VPEHVEIRVFRRRVWQDGDVARVRRPSDIWVNELVQLDRNHPGFRDLEYRQRRNTIARIALEYVDGPIPQVHYSEAEQQVWRLVSAEIAPLHETFAFRDYLALRKAVDLSTSEVPQLESARQILARESSFSLAPVAGLVSPRAFLGALGQGLFLSTQYIRHASAPFYTPEPDIVHELLGHVVPLASPRIAALNRRFGAAAARSDQAQLERLNNLYWYGVEFSVVEEDGELRAFGAGLLSSRGEIARFREHADLRPWDLRRMSSTSYEPTEFQSCYYVAPSYEALFETLEQTLDGWPACIDTL
jgi:phenylalanine-4-hydroxylase